MRVCSLELGRNKQGEEAELEGKVCPMYAMEMYTICFPNMHKA